jgi:uncharacterized protein YjbI with pentapeptide repeats
MAVDVEPTQTRREERATARGWQLLDLSFLSKPPPAFAGFVYAVVAIAFVVVLVTGLWIVCQFVHQSLSVPPKDFEDISRRLLAIGVIVAAPFAIWRILVSHWQARAAEQQAVAAARQADVAREEHYTTLFTTAVQQLGAMREIRDQKGTRTEPNTEARLGALYALERIAQDSERDHWPIMETLCAYVRKNAGAPVFIEDDLLLELGRRAEHVTDGLRKAAQERARPYVDVQAAITVIGRRSADRIKYENRLRAVAGRRDAFSLDLTRTNLAGVVFNGNFDFARFDRSSLAFAQFIRASADSARFGDVHGPGMQVLNCSIKYASISGEFSGTTFVDTKAENWDALWPQMSGTEFSDCSLRSSNLYSADFTGSSFYDCDSKTPKW